MVSLFDSRAFNGRLFFPRRDPGGAPAGAIDREIAVPGARLHLRRHPNPGAVPLLLFHGNGEIVADYDEVAERFAAAGAELSVVDYRGYGRSTGEPTLRTAITDARVVASAFAAEIGGPFVVMGRSLGSAAAAELYGAPVAGMVGVVWESGFVDLEASALRRGLPMPPEIPSEDLAVFDPTPKLRRGRLPMLVLHGAEDDLIDPAEARAAFDACGAADKRLVLVPGHGHNDVGLAPVYWAEMAAFLGGRAVSGQRSAVSRT
jgi:hypothetical protein